MGNAEGGSGSGARRPESSPHMLHLGLQDAQGLSDHALHAYDCAKTVARTSEHQGGGRFHLPGLQGSMGSSGKEAVGPRGAALLPGEGPGQGAESIPD